MGLSGIAEWCREMGIVSLSEMFATGEKPMCVTWNLDEFSRANRRRCEARNGFNHKLSDWSLSDWMTATLGELGEAANVAKKLNRVRDGIPGNSEPESELKNKLADELADTFIYLDLLCQSQGIDLEYAVRSKFNRTSQKIGYIA